MNKPTSVIHTAQIIFAGIIACLPAFCPPLCAQDSPRKMPAEYFAAQKNYRKLVAAIDNKYAKFQETLISEYEKQLKTAEDKFMANGNLDGVLAARKERERLQETQELFPPEEKTGNTIAELKELQERLRVASEKQAADRKTEVEM